MHSGEEEWDFLNADIDRMTFVVVWESQKTANVALFLVDFKDMQISNLNGKRKRFFRFHKPMVYARPM